MDPRILVELDKAAKLNPDISFGRLVESIESIAWDMIEERPYAPRLSNLPDYVMLAAIDQWVRIPFQRNVVRY